MAKPSQDTGAAAIAAEQPGIERERRFADKAAFALFEPLQCFREAVVRCRPCGQRVAQGTLALPGELEQIVFGQAKQRALQRHRQRQIVLRQQQCVRKVHQVDDRDVLGQLEPVGARNGNIGVLQRLDHRIERVAAASHQHQHVAIAQRPARAVAAGHGAAFDQRFDFGLNAPGKFDFCTHQRDAVERRTPAFEVLLVIGDSQFPEIDQARAGVFQRIMDRIAIIDRMNAAIDVLIAKHMIDRMQDRRA